MLYENENQLLQIEKYKVLRNHYFYTKIVELSKIRFIPSTCTFYIRSAYKSGSCESFFL